MPPPISSSSARSPAAPKFSVITPSYRGSEWLKLCIASVADQGVPVEHIVQDSCSDDGTGEWLPQDRRVRAYIERDEGMYDAINRGLRRARGGVLSYLNCDEQYLPGALATVGAWFDRHPEVEVLFADAIVVDPEGRYMCHRRASLPGRYHSQVSHNLAVLTAATFFRRSLIEERKLFFDASYRVVGDAIWVLQLLEHKVRLGLLRQVTSVFTETGENLCLAPKAQPEIAAVMARAPVWARWGRHLVVAHYRLRRLFAGHYWPERPFDYSIYTRAQSDQRSRFHAAHPTFRFRRILPSRAG